MSYWKRRQEETYKAGEMTVNQYFTKLEKAFNQAKRDLQKTVESFYWRYAEENSLTYTEAQKRLDKAEIGSFGSLLIWQWLILANTTRKSIICPLRPG